MASYAFVLVVGLFAGALSGIIGTGASIMLLPVLVFQFGPKQAVPMMAIAGLMSNIAKVWAWWREVDWRAFCAYSVTGVPAAALGARTLLVLPSHWVDVALGTFFLLMIPGRRWLTARHLRIGLWQLAVAGGIIGFLTGIVISTGPLSVPAFTSYGLLRGAFISTEAASSLALFVSKVTIFRHDRCFPRKSGSAAHERRRFPAHPRRAAAVLRPRAAVGGADGLEANSTGWITHAPGRSRESGPRSYRSAVAPESRLRGNAGDLIPCRDRYSALQPHQAARE